MPSLRFILPLALAACAWAPSIAAAGGDPPGMVLKLSGETAPPLREHEEVPADAALQLRPGTTLTFVHYGKCKRVTVTGGSLRLTASDYSVTGGNIDSEKNFPCPPVRRIAAGEAASVVSRGIPPRFPLNAEFVFTGKRADRVTAAAIYLDKQPEDGPPVAALGLAEDRVVPTPGAAPLETNRRYLLKVTTSFQPAPIELRFIAGAAAEDAALVVLRVD